MRENIEHLINSGVSAYRVSKETGIPNNTVVRIFSGEAKIDNITLKNAEILSNYWEENKMKDYGTAFEMVKEALNDSGTYDLAVAFTQKNDGAVVQQIVADQFHQAADGVDDFNMTVEQYLYARLEESDNMLFAGAFENEAEAENEGYYWDDSIGMWLKLGGF